MLGDVFERYVGEATCERSLIAFHKLFDVVAFREASGHDAEVVITTICSAHYVRGWRSEGLWSFWFHEAILIAFICCAYARFFQYGFAESTKFFSDVLHPRPDHENNDMKKPETAWRRFISLSRFFFVLHGGLFHFLYTCSRADVIMVVSTKPPIIMRVCFFPVRRIIYHVLCIHFLTWCS